ncbi:DUF2254 domain-containing protein [Haloarcula hispanica]|uniref:DUF2254 domain-containing protein n=1 Tax=Haloarcula hispanica TaxID=51589 RepID=A0A5J5LMS6_HALHI|nr:DUF2254 family protein [Haloarcula hispanica]KAA9410976.1 DUF2254 domain-containing protein [Haloarcula hispanica]
MNGFSNHPSPNITDRLYFYAVISLFAGPFIAFGLGVWLIPNPESIDNVRFLLTSIIATQASILAIVFSITILAVQLASNRYSPRIINQLLEDSYLKTILIIFGFSIGLDLALIYFQPSTSPIQTWYLGLIYASIAIAFAAGLHLWSFIRHILIQTTPEGVIDSLAGSVDLEYCLDRLSEANQTERHPLNPFYAVVANSIQSDERMATNHAFRRYIETIEQLLEEIYEGETVDKNNKAVKNLLTQIFGEQMPDLLTRAAIENEKQLISEITACNRQLAETASINSDTVTVSNVYSGFVEILKDQSVSEHSDLTLTVITHSAGLIQNLVYQGEYDYASEILNQLNQDLADISEDGFEHRNHHLIERLAVSLRAVPLLILQNENKNIASDPIISSTHPERRRISGSTHPASDCLEQWHYLNIKTSQILLKSERRYNNYSTDVPCLIWEETTKKAFKMRTNRYGRHCLRTLFELATRNLIEIDDEVVQSGSMVVSIGTQNQKISRWIEHIASVRISVPISDIEEVKNQLDIYQRGTSNTFTSLRGENAKFMYCDPTPVTREDYLSILQFLSQSSKDKNGENIIRATSQSELRNAVKNNLSGVDSMLKSPTDVSLQVTTPFYSNNTTQFGEAFGEDSLLVYDSNLEPVVIKIISSLEESDINRLKNQRDRLEKESKAGSLRMVILCPDSRGEIRDLVKTHNLEFSYFDSTDYIIPRQTTLEEYIVERESFYNSRFVKNTS